MTIKKDLMIKPPTEPIVWTCKHCGRRNNIFKECECGQKTKPPKSLYQELREKDILGWLMPLFENGYYLDFDCRIRQIFPHIDVHSGWINTVRHPKTNCRLWHKIFFDLLGILPSQCLNCYKVVAKPNQLNYLFELLKLQEELQLPCKCGVEARPNVPFRYGGYWYNWGLEKGLETWELVRKEVYKIDSGIDVILKRGCTEYEDPKRYGPSNKWDELITDEQRRKEEEATALMDLPPVPEQPEICKIRSKITWIEMAYGTGDWYFRNYTGGVNLSYKYVTYHNLGG